jgi:hypothetical protein
MSLRSTFDQLLAEARRRGGASAERHLQGGAIVRVRAEPGSNKVMVVISRVDLLVGETELETFKKHFGIPADAERRPTDGQDYIETQRRHRVAFIWAKPFELFEQEGQ